MDSLSGGLEVVKYINLNIWLDDIVATFLILLIFIKRTESFSG